MKVIEAGAKLLGGARAEVVVQEVGLIGIVGAPAQQVHRQTAGLAASRNAPDSITSMVALMFRFFLSCAWMSWATMPGSGR